jgi:hypothetical protein
MVLMTKESKMHIRKFRLLEEADASGGGGEAAAAVAQPADAGSVLSAAKPADAAPTEWLAEKFRVMNGETLDVEASARKLAESYAGLEKRVGSGDLPPKSADEYALTVPDQLKDAWQEDDRFKAFKTDMHAAGITQKQFDLVMGKYFTVVPEMAQASAQLTMDKATEELRATWKSDAEFTENVSGAFKAFKSFADPADLDRIDEIGNSPVALRILAKISKEMGEGGGIPSQADSVAAEDIQALLRNPAYLDNKHADHKAVSQKVQQYYAKKHGNAVAA